MRFALVFIFIPVAAMAEGLQYFDNKIDYWGNGAEKHVEPSSEVEKQGEKFPWKTYLDPKNKEFFKEGDYTPPEPFMEVARNPSDNNIKSWFEFMQKKNELARRLQIKMQEYLARNQTPGSPVQIPQTIAVQEPTPPQSNVRVDPARFHFRMYFESTCPHCRKMFSVLKRLKDEGFMVEALEVDNGPVPEAEKIVPIGKADPAELQKHGVKGVPFVLIADVKRQALLPAVEGYHDYEELVSLMKAASK